jgi:very-short-patch-repair endonuclease
MKIDKAEKDRLADLIRESADYLVHYGLVSTITTFEKYCESPIEILFGVAFDFLVTTISPGTLWNTCMNCRISKWEIRPQFCWENYRIDFAILTKLPYPIFIECDGHEFHERTKEQAGRDREKDRRIQAAGIPILRFTGSQIHANPNKCAMEVYDFIKERLKQSQEKVA